MATESPETKPDSLPSQPSEVSRLSWFSPRFFLAILGMGIGTYIALGPMLVHLNLAATEKSWWHLGVAGILALFPLAAFFPTSIRDMAALVEAPSKLVTAVKGALSKKDG